VADKKQLLDELNYLTELLSNRSRILATGIVAFTWVYILANLTSDKLSGVFDTQYLLIPMALSVMALLLDAFQYWIGYIQIRIRFREMERKQIDQTSFDNSSLLFKLRTGVFYGKQALVLISIVWLLIVIWQAILA